MTLNQTKSLIKGILKENNKKLVSNINTNIDTKIKESVPNIENVAAFTPIGTIIAVMGNEAPENYLVCDGSIYNITDYQELANYFETQFGSKNHFGGDGTTTFAVPDLRGEFLRGTGTNSHANQGNGANVGIHQDGTQHEFVDHAKNSSGYYMGAYYSNDKEWYNPVNVDSRMGSIDIRAYFKETGHHDNVDTGSYYTSRPTNTSVLYCIATKNIYLGTTNNLVSSKNYYSEQEQVVGVWIDGKPLYQKTFQTTIPDTTTRSKNVSLSGLNIDKVVGVDTCQYDNNGMYGGTINVTSATMYDVNTIATTFAYINYQNSNLVIFNSFDGYDDRVCFVTLKYTKTTD